MFEPWFPYRLTGAIIAARMEAIAERPWFPYRLTGAIIQRLGSEYSD